MADARAERQYAKILADRAKNAARNAERAASGATKASLAEGLAGTVTKDVAGSRFNTLNKLLGGTRGSSSIMPMLGMAALAPAAMGIAKKAQEGDLKGAALEAADTGSYLIPGVGQARLLGEAAMGELGTTPESEAIENPQSKQFQELRKKLTQK